MQQVVLAVVNNMIVIIGENGVCFMRMMEDLDRVMIKTNHQINYTMLV